MGLIISPEMKMPVTLTAGQYLKIKVIGNGGKVMVMQIDGASSAQTELAAMTTGTTTLGPYGDTKSLVIHANDCAAEYDTGAITQTGSADTLVNSGVMILSGAGAPVDYTDGDPAATGEGWAIKGALYIDTTNAKIYINGGTEAQPVWKLVTSAA